LDTRGTSNALLASFFDDSTPSLKDCEQVLKEMMNVLTTDSSAFISKTIMPLQAFPVIQNNR
jgi:hypothetical protein